MTSDCDEAGARRRTNTSKKPILTAAANQPITGNTASKMATTHAARPTIIDNTQNKQCDPKLAKQTQNKNKTNRETLEYNLRHSQTQTNR